MKKILSAALCFVLMASFASCDVAPKRMAKAYFWSSKDHNDPQVLVIDGKKSGRLPYVDDREVEEDSDVVNNALAVDLSTGKYELQVINNNGRVITEGMLEFTKSARSESVTTSWGKGADCKVKIVYQ